MQFADIYLQKHQFLKISLQKPPSGLLSYIVVIPSFNEPDITSTLQSLRMCSLPNRHIEVIVVTNYSETTDVGLKATINHQHKTLVTWAETHSTPEMQVLPVMADNLPLKHAGAGLARKIGMDLAVDRFRKVGNPEGIIFSLDADSLAPTNYFTRLESNILAKSVAKGWIFNFDLTSNLAAGNARIQKAAQQYELYLRYYRHALKYANYPVNHYTIGSCFAVQVDAYCKQGGMNRRQAGEDCYFLQKIIANYPVEFRPTIIVRPASRTSNRVPFGTGPILSQLITSANISLETYPLSCFEQVKNLLEMVPSFYNTHAPITLLEKLPDLIKSFLKIQSIAQHLDEINRNTGSRENFTARFIRWFDGLKVLQFFNYCIEQGVRKVAVDEAANQLYYAISQQKSTGTKNMLDAFRQLDQKG